MKKTFLGLLCALLMGGGTCLAHQYDSQLVTQSRPDITNPAMLYSLIIADIKKATDYNNVFENEELQVTMEIDYDLSLFCTKYSTLSTNGYYIDYDSLVKSNYIFMLEREKNLLYHFSPSHIVMIAKNKTNSPMEINLSKSMISFCYGKLDTNVAGNNGLTIGYLGKPYNFTTLKDPNNWIFKLAPMEENVIRLYPAATANARVVLQTDTELLGKFYLNVNGKYLNMDMKGRINPEKLSWKADSSLARNRIEKQTLPVIDANDVQRTKKEALPDWAL